MRIIPEPVVFEWDKGNRDKNEKHGVFWREAEEVFENRPLLVSRDIAHSRKEQRYRALGKTNQERLLFLSFTIRGTKIRIISARGMNKKERRQYGKKT